MHPWRSLLLLVAFSLLVPPVASGKTETSAAALTPRQVVERLQRVYEQTRSLRAEFFQETMVPMSRRRRTARGTVAFLKPGRMRWDYLAPDHQVLVSDGRRVFLYLAKDSQLLIRPVDEYLKSDVSYAFFAGNGDLLKDFLPEPAPGRRSPESYVIKLVPRKLNPQLDHLYVWVDRQRFLIRRLEIVDQFGSVTTLVFKNIEKNPALSPKQFRFTPPPGTEIIEQ